MAPPQLDRYVVEGELGQGGMSVVYRARDTKLPRPVAVKVLHEFLARQDEARHRFHREAVAVASLEHRGVLAIYDYSGPNASPSFIVTELIDGPTLRELVELEGAFPWPEMAMLVTAELASALAHAHQSGVVHRDIKPENVMIHRDGQLKLMDFGIAEMVGGSTQLTATGALIGSPAHMAPELIDGKRSDHRADVFSLGTLLYWLSTGSLPFAGPNPSALFKRILDGVYTPPQQLQPKVGNGLARIIARSLAPDPEQRLPTAQALHDALVEELEPLGLTPIETTSRQLLLDRGAFMARQTPLLLDGLVALGEAAVEDRRLARASDAFNRVLAHEPEEPRARHWLETLRTGQRRRRRLGLSAALLLALGSSALGASYALRSGDSPTESPTEPSVAAASEEERSDRPVLTEARLTPPEEPLPPPPETTPSVPPPRTAPASRRPRPSAPPQEAPPVRASLIVQIGRAYADIYVDDALVADLKFRARVELDVGAHTVRVVRDKAKILSRLGLQALPEDRSLPQFGRFEARIIEVSEDGRIMERREDGLRPLVDDVLLFKIPLTRGEGRQIEGWISS